MLFLKSTKIQLAPGVYAVDVAAKPPGTTFMIYAAVTAGEPPAAFIQAIEGMGFKQVLSKSYKHHDGKEVVDLHFHKPGTGIFEGWTPEEKATNLETMEKIFAGMNIKIEPRVMSLAEAFG